MSDKTKLKISLANSGKKRTEEQRKKISNSLKGRKLSSEWIKKISLSNKGKKMSIEFKENCRKRQLLIRDKLVLFGKSRKDIFLKNMNSDSSKIKRRNTFRNNKLNSINRIGKNNPNWKGGTSSLQKLIRMNSNTKQWREAVFKRDNYTCIIKKCPFCLNRVCNRLEAHHKITLVDILKKYNISTIEQALECQELWDINNGVTLCHDVHKILHIFGIKKLDYQSINIQEALSFLNSLGIKYRVKENV
jgi:hypothetical protein